MIAGTWLLCQLLGGKALQRLGVYSSSKPADNNGNVGGSVGGDSGFNGNGGPSTGGGGSSW